MRKLLSIIGLAAALGLKGALVCTGSNTPVEGSPVNSAVRKTMTQARVIMDIFSGRENPSWELSAEKSRVVRETLKDLPMGGRPMPIVTLGYRGFTVTWEDGARAKVYRDVIEYSEGQHTTVHEDAKREVELQLLADAKTHLAPALFNAVESQVLSP